MRADARVGGELASSYFLRPPPSPNPRPEPLAAVHSGAPGTCSAHTRSSRPASSAVTALATRHDTCRAVCDCTLQPASLLLEYHPLCSPGREGERWLCSLPARHMQCARRAGDGGRRHSLPFPLWWITTVTALVQPSQLPPSQLTPSPPLIYACTRTYRSYYIVCACPGLCSSPGGRRPRHTRSVRGSLLRAPVPGSLLRARSCVLVRSFVRSFFH